MKRSTWPVITAVLITAAILSTFWASGAPAQPKPKHASDRLAVLWTSGDPEVAHRVCLMYTHYAQKSGDYAQVLLIVWGPSSRLLAADKDLQAKVKSMMNDGLRVEACVACADSYGVSDRLGNMGITVKPMGPPLTEMIQSGSHVLTF